jgi:hypothetical protein
MTGGSVLSGEESCLSTESSRFVQVTPTSLPVDSTSREFLKNFLDQFKAVKVKKSEIVKPLFAEIQAMPSNWLQHFSRGNEIKFMEQVLPKQFSFVRGENQYLFASK